MNLLDRFLGHDAWTTRQLLLLCQGMSDEQLDREFDIGHRTLRATFLHIIRNMEIWSGLMCGMTAAELRSTDSQGETVSELLGRLDLAAERLAKIAREVVDRDAWDETWVDSFENPPVEKKFGTAIAHVITHSMHHRSQVLFLLRKSGLTGIPEGDVFSWENEVGRGLSDH